MAFIRGLNQFLNICWGRKKYIKIEYELNYEKVKGSISKNEGRKREYPKKESILPLKIITDPWQNGLVQK